MLGRDQRAELGGRLHAVAEHQGVRSGRQLRHELLFPAGIDVEAGVRGADLTGVDHAALQVAGHRGIDVRVPRDDGGGLAAQLEGEPLEVGVGAGMGDRPTTLGGTGVGHVVDVRVPGQCLADLRATGDDIDHPGRDARLMGELDQSQRGQ
ncbi:hypothetical protein SDC9_112782 [bioreactor metagenome]|uniref:Uncharacterized protein n=1 Tax=bioreactor metagenome TaxID=1076179 RepID=A0A645BL92_9ZZZZ